VTARNALCWLAVCALSPLWLPLLTVMAFWHLGCSAVDYARWRYRFSDCAQCGSPYCPRTGPWYARRRWAIYCPGCMPELYRKEPAQ
jgi:hypothetical protein